MKDAEQRKTLCVFLLKNPRFYIIIAMPQKRKER